MNLKIKNKTTQLVSLVDVDGVIVPLLPRAEVVIDAARKSQDMLIKEERGIIVVTDAQ